MAIAILIISFLLDGVLSNYLPLNYAPLFSIVGLIISYDFTNEKNKYYISAFILGICYDLIYTNTFIFYGCLFMFIAFIITHISKLLNSNYLNLALSSIICTTVFRTITFFSLFLTGNINLNFIVLYRSIYRSLIVSIIYGIILKLIVSLIDNFKKKRKKYY